MGKNIWIFHHYADPPDGHWTGTYDLYKFLVQRGHNVTVFSSSFSHYSRKEERLKNHEKSREQIYNGMRFVFVKTPWYKGNNWRRSHNMLTYAVRAYALAKLRKDKPDVVVGSTPHPFCAYTALLMAKKHEAKFFLELHDLWLEYMFDTGVLSKRNPIAYALKYLDLQLYSNANKIFALWPKMHDYTLQFGIPREKIVWMPLGVDFDEFKSPPKMDMKNDGHFLVMCAARFGPAANIDEILKAAKIIRDKGYDKISFSFLGDGPEKKNLLQFVKDENLSSVEFRGLVPKGDIPKSLAEADTCIAGLPDVPNYRKYGTIPTKLIDYMSSGRPTVFITTLKESLVEQANTGFVVPPHDPEAMANAIIKLYKMSPEERTAMGQNGVRYLRENHDLRKISLKLESYL